MKITSDVVKQSGIIKQKIIVNSLDEKIVNQKENVEVYANLMFNALSKRNEILKSISKLKDNLMFEDIKLMKPLILVQLPDENKKHNLNTTFYLNKITNAIKNFDEKNLIDYDYAVWLSDQKSSPKEDITKFNSDIKVLIFKQAIATGWDVPRASILVKLRNYDKPSEKFEIQTIGLIMRQPALKIFKLSDFNDDATLADVRNLNNAFVYTNDKKFSDSLISDYELGNSTNEAITRNEYQISKKANEEIITKLNLMTISETDSLSAKQVALKLTSDKIFMDNLLKKYTSKNLNIILDHFREGEIDTRDYLNNDQKFDQLELFDRLGIVLDLVTLESLFLDLIKNDEILIGFVDLFKQYLINNLDKNNIHKITIKSIYKFFREFYNQPFFNIESLKKAFEIKIGNILDDHIVFRQNSLFKFPKAISYNQNIAKLPKESDYE